MIDVSLTAAQAIDILRFMPKDSDVSLLLTQKFAELTGDVTTMVTLRSMPGDQMIPVIKAIRAANGWGLREAKEFCERVRGKYSSCGSYVGGYACAFPCKNRTAAMMALTQLTAIGCSVELAA